MDIRAECVELLSIFRTLAEKFREGTHGEKISRTHSVVRAVSPALSPPRQRGGAMCTPEARPCRVVRSWVRALCRCVSARLSSPLPQSESAPDTCVRPRPRSSRQGAFCAQHSAAALLCLLLAAVGAPARAELSQSEFNRIMTRFRAQAQGASAVSNHCPCFLY